MEKIYKEMGPAGCGHPGPDAMAKINDFARAELAPEDVYTFSILLCDNEVDRDFERFTEKSLHNLAALFLGTCNVFDHNWSAHGQTARIYHTEVKKEPGVQTEGGRPYLYLKGYAYMLRENNEALIKAIEAGIKKEVSIGCSVEKSLCSICGNDITDRTKCTHIKGMRYPIGGEEKLCYAELDDATDVYEWSFVAVPAQRRAGVMKAFDAKGGETLTYSEKIAQLAGRDEALLKELKKLETEAATGRLYLEELRRETKRLSGLSGLGIDPETFGSVADRMTPEELKAFKSAFEQRAGARYIGKAQIAGEETLPAATDDGFMI